MNIEELLDKAIRDDLENLSGVDFGSDEYKIGVDGLTKLIDQEIELRRLEIERQEKIESRKNDDEFKLKQLRDTRIDRIIGYAVNVAGIVIPVAVTIWGTKVSLKFEEEGTITTTAGRNFFGKLFSKR